MIPDAAAAAVDAWTFVSTWVAMGTLFLEDDDQDTRDHDHFPLLIWTLIMIRVRHHTAEPTASTVAR